MEPTVGKNYTTIRLVPAYFDHGGKEMSSSLPSKTIFKVVSVDRDNVYVELTDHEEFHLRVTDFTEENVLEITVI